MKLRILKATEYQITATCLLQKDGYLYIGKRSAAQLGLKVGDNVALAKDEKGRMYLLTDLEDTEDTFQTTRGGCYAIKIKCKGVMKDAGYDYEKHSIRLKLIRNSKEDAGWKAWAIVRS